MGEVKNMNQGRQKPTYDELKNWCDQLAAQNNELYQKLGSVLNAYNKLPFLFEVLKNSTFFDEDFVQDAAQDIKSILGKPKGKEDKENK